MEAKKEGKITISRSLIESEKWSEIEKAISTVEDLCPFDRRQRVVLGNLNDKKIVGWKTEKGNIHVEVMT